MLLFHFATAKLSDDVIVIKQMVSYILLTEVEWFLILNQHYKATHK